MIKKIFFILVILLEISCHHSTPQNQLQEGDILFQNLNCGELCDAIETVTKGIDGKNFSHCSMVVKINDTLKVVEAIGSNVQVNSLHHFFARSGDTTIIKNITIARLKSNYKNLIPAASTFIKQQIGKPYDDEFILNNGSWYCSELLYEAFKINNSSIFTTEPMTFKDPKTNAFFPAWIKYYKNLNKQIPEGKQGINPGLMSRSNNIEILKMDTLNLNSTAN